MVTFDWTAQQQAYVLSGYFWGYSISCLVGGTAAEFWGPRKLVFVTMLLIAILTILSPQAARIHYMALVAVRFVSGLAAVSYEYFVLRLFFNPLNIIDTKNRMPRIVIPKWSKSKKIDIFIADCKFYTRSTFLQA